MAVLNNNIIHVPPLDVKINPRGLGNLFFEKLKEHDQLIAQIDGATGEFETFNDLLHDCINIALELKKLGFKKGDIIGICSYNHLDCCKPFIAAMFLGLQVASFDPTLSLEDTVHLLKQLTTRIIFVSDNAIDLVQSAIKLVQRKVDLVLFGELDSLMSFKKFKEHHEGHDKFIPEQNVDELDVAVIMFSSGTTSAPKGICLTHYGIEYQSHICSLHFINFNNSINYKFNEKEGTANTPIMSFASLHWISSVIFLGCNILQGITRVLPKYFSAEWCWEYLKKYKVAVFLMPPNQLIETINNKPIDAYVSDIKNILVGGNSCSVNYILQARDIFTASTIFQSCGQTEVSLFLTAFKNVSKDIELLKAKPKSCGTPIEGFTYKIVDPDTEEVLGVNQCGELRVKTKTALKGYYNLDCSQVFDSEGFVKTGDLMYYDEDLCFYHVERIKEMLRYKTWQMTPATLEAILHSHPAVKHAVVVGLPHPADGQHPLAFVVLHKEYYNTTSDDLLNYFNKKVDERSQLRGGLFFIDNLPLTATGKINRRELKEKAIKMQASF